MSKGDLTLEAVISLFPMNRETRNYSPKTVRWYSDMSGRFADSFDADEKIASIDANAINQKDRASRLGLSRSPDISRDK